MSSELDDVSEQQIRQLIDELITWCAGEYGRQQELASALGVSRSIVSHWVASRRIPNWKHALKIQQFLKERLP